MQGYSMEFRPFLVFLMIRLKCLVLKFGIETSKIVTVFIRRQAISRADATKQKPARGSDLLVFIMIAATWRGAGPARTVSRTPDASLSPLCIHLDWNIKERSRSQQVTLYIMFQQYIQIIIQSEGCNHDPTDSIRSQLKTYKYLK